MTETKKTTITVSDELVETARKLGEHKTHLQAAIAALREYIERREQRKILSLFGTIDYDRSYDYKRERKRLRGALS